MSRLLVLLLMAHSALLAAGSPALLVAIRNGDHSTAQKLLRAGAHVNTVDSDGTTALMHAADAGCAFDGSTCGSRSDGGMAAVERRGTERDK